MTGLHEEATRTLRGWEAPDAEQEALRAAYLAHLAAHPDAPWRSCHPDHLTASTLLLSPDGAEVLLQLHAKAGRWFQLGGHLEEGDDSLAAGALREAGEESGLTGLAIDPVPVQLSRHEVRFCDPRGLVDHLDVRFVARPTGPREPVVNEESLALRWWPVGALPTDDPDILALVDLALARTSTEPGRVTRR